ncbi:cysteine hydrolase family protein [Janibacter sp. G349]|uniref:cysteine hydrolase family protein n=1 Tax=Janibacter sp. G349 TaxID=3405424 RepID=UPI003B786E97
MDQSTAGPHADHAPWRAPLERTAVLAIDLQEAFFEDPALAARRDALVARCRQVLRWAEAERLPVVAVRTVHRRDRSTWTITMRQDDQGFLFDGAPHTASLAELDLTSAIEVVKTRDDAFVETGLAEVLSSLAVEAVVVVGVSTHTCVQLTAAHAFAADLEVVLVRDAIASYRPELHELVLDVLRDEYRFPVVSADALCRVTTRPTEGAR